MADMIVQPMVKNENGEYDELIINSAVSADIGQYASTDTSKGTIEDRLSALENTERVEATINYTYLSENSHVFLYRKANFVIADCHIVFKDGSSMYEFFSENVKTAILFTVPEGFMPSESQPFVIGSFIDGTITPPNGEPFGVGVALSKKMLMSTGGAFVSTKYVLDYYGYDVYGTEFRDATFSRGIPTTAVDFQIGYFL